MSTSNTSRFTDSQYFYAACFRWAADNPAKSNKHLSELTLDDLEEIIEICIQLKNEGVEP